MSLSTDDVSRLMRRASGRGHTGERNRALVTAFAGAGLGVSEALSVTPGDLDADAGEVRVGGSRPRRIAVDEHVMAILTSWADARRALGLADEGPLFCTRDGLPLEASYVRRLVARLGREAEIDGIVNARRLRESYAAARIAEGASAQDLRDALGHTSIASTQRYVRQLGTVAATEHPGLAPDLLEALLGAAHCGLTVLRAVRDLDGAIDDFLIEYVNPAAAGIMGYSPDLLPGSSVRERFPNSPDDGTYARWIELIETQGRGGEQRHHESEGRARQFRVRRVAIGDRIVMSFDDMSARKAAESALGLLEARHSALLEVCPIGVMVLDTEGVITTANPAAGLILGVPSDHLVGRSPFDPRWRAVAQDGEPLPPARLPVVIAQTTGVPVRGAVIGIGHPEGRTIWISVDAEPVEGGGGPPFSVAVVFSDLRPLREAQARARVAEEALALLAGGFAGFLLRCRPDGVILSASSGVADVLGYAPEELVGRRCDEPVDPRDVPAVRAAYLAAMASHDTVHLDHGVRDSSGAGVDVSRDLRAVRDPASGDVEEVHSLIRVPREAPRPPGRPPPHPGSRSPEAPR